MWKRKRDTVTVMIKVTNKLSSPRTLVIEPWLNAYALPVGKALDVTFTGKPHYSLKLEVEDDRFVLFGFDSAGATMSVKDNGVQAKWLRPS
jgi:hypothetical protein